MSYEILVKNTELVARNKGVGCEYFGVVAPISRIVAQVVCFFIFSLIYALYLDITSDVYGKY